MTRNCRVHCTRTENDSLAVKSSTNTEKRPRKVSLKDKIVNGFRFFKGVNLIRVGN